LVTTTAMSLPVPSDQLGSYLRQINQFPLLSAERERELAVRLRENNDLEAARETSRLLSELDRAIDQSSALRDIVRKYEHLRSIESITGPSRLTRIMRKEIQIMESRLRLLRAAQEMQQQSPYPAV